MRQATLKDLLRELWLRERNSGYICWTTKEGKQVLLKDMTDIHLVNTINMIVEHKEDMEHIGDMSPLDYYD